MPRINFNSIVEYPVNSTSLHEEYFRLEYNRVFHLTRVKTKKSITKDRIEALNGQILLLQNEIKKLTKENLQLKSLLSANFVNGSSTVGNLNFDNSRIVALESTPGPLIGPSESIIDKILIKTKINLIIDEFVGRSTILTNEIWERYAYTKNTGKGKPLFRMTGIKFFDTYSRVSEAREGRSISAQDWLDAIPSWGLTLLTISGFSHHFIAVEKHKDGSDHIYIVLLFPNKKNLTPAHPVDWMYLSTGITFKAGTNQFEILRSASNTV